MSKNSRQINYRLRIAKAVERKMFCSAFQKLSVFHPLEDYKYIGFGALYFSDFYLIHRQLGIKKMVSIEKSSSASIKARYNFNKPFKCIEIKFNESNVILPQLEWKEPSIVWLDYTSTLNNVVLSDLDTVVRNAIPGSLVIISVSADSDEFENRHTPEKTRLEFLQELIGKNRIPREIKNNQITNSGLPTIYAKILRSEIESLVVERNSGSSGNAVTFEQIFNLKYRDGKPMYSYGGIILDSSQTETFTKVKFDELPFVMKDENVFEIDVPNLTLKEIKFLESLLPQGISGDGKIDNIEELSLINPNIPEKDVKNFAKIYQYFPNFAETNLG